MDSMEDKDRKLARKTLEGTIYVFELASGIVKVGQTRDPKTRSSAHRHLALSMGTEIVNYWSSEAHVGWLENEDRLISFCLKQYGKPVSGRESFADAKFEAVLAYAQSLEFFRASEAQLQAEVDRVKAAVERFEKLFFRTTQQEVEEPQRGPDPVLEGLKSEAMTIIGLANDANREQANEAYLEVAKRMFSLTQPPWSSDAMAVYLMSRGRREPEVEEVCEFELTMRTLFAISFQREAASFEELISHIEQHESPPSSQLPAA